MHLLLVRVPLFKVIFRFEIAITFLPNKVLFLFFSISLVPLIQVHSFDIFITNIESSIGGLVILRFGKSFKV